MGHEFIAVDWGTTNRRAWRIVDGQVVEELRDGLGLRAITDGDFAGAAASLRARLGGAPMLMAGMVGSNRGWIDAGYVDAPAGIEALAAALCPATDGVRIVPGLCRRDGMRGDVMRGEEVQLLGAVAAGLAPPDALMCQPGTHCKWARMAGGRIADFTTAMTGEMFALLRDHALIGAEMIGAVTDGVAFRDGVRDGADGDLLGALFGVRAASVLALRARDDLAAYASGLLIGADCAAREEPGEVYLIADDALGALYAAAIDVLGGRTIRIDADTAFLAGITRLWEMTE